MSKAHHLACERLGDYIEQRTLRNSALQYGADLIEGVNSAGVFCHPKACTDGIDLAPYKIVQNGDFVYNPSRLNLGSLAYRTGDMCIVSHLYIVFYLTEYGKKRILPEYLFIFFRRNEFYRLVNYRNFGSQRPEFNFQKLSDVPICIPSIAEQKKIVTAWKALRAMKEHNEAMAEPLFALCRSRLQEMKKEYAAVEIGKYLSPVDERNRDLSIKLSQGISNEKYFQTPKQVAQNSTSDKIVRCGHFAYNRATTRNGDKISIAFREGEDCTVSSSYQVFFINNIHELNPLFLLMWFKRPEFDRYARYMSKGSAHEFFEYDDMCRVKIPLPPLSVQKALVDVYRCAAEARRIAEEADRLSREICPALIQHAVRGGN